MAYATRWQDVVVVALALTACGFDSGGVGDGSSGGTSSGSTDTNPSTDPATTNPTDPATTDPATTDPATTDPATTDPATTDPATTDPSTDPTTTDPSTDPTTTDPTTDPSDTDATDDTDPSQGTTGDPDAAYGPCDGNTCPDDQMCSVVVNEQQTVIGTSCREPCESADTCPVPETGNPEVLCPTPNYAWCVLGCQFGQCPDGMTCYDTQYGDLCYWDI